jgi:DNA-binding protein YbaB
MGGRTAIRLEEAVVAGESPTLRDLAKQVQATRERYALAVADLAEKELTRSAGGGLVTVTMRGNGAVTVVAFDRAAVDKRDAEALAALTLDALGQAADAVKSLATDKLEAALVGPQAGSEGGSEAGSEAGSEGC